MVEQALIERQTELSANIVAFCRYLRAKQFKISPEEESDALRAIVLANAIRQPDLLKLTLECTLVRSAKQKQEFDQHFKTYWKELEKAINSKKKDNESKSKSPAQTKQEAFLAIKNWLSGNQTDSENTNTATYSPKESLSKRSFLSFQREELQEVLQIIRAIARKLAYKLARKKTISNRPNVLHIKKTLRQNIRRGGEIIDLIYQKPKLEKQQIVLLCDISQSMELYSQFLIQFIYGFQSVYRYIETFTFGTRLTRVSQELKEGDADIAIQNLVDKVADWSGGTKIGESLHEFVVSYSSKFINNKTIVFILSDGLDTGETELIAESLRKIKRRGARIIWLNPLAGNPAYQPEAKGMKAAIPHIDTLAPVHNIESLKALAKLL